MKKSIVALALAAACAAAWALPSTQDVEAAVKQGRYAQAETLLAEVVASKPNSAKAHYVYAEVLAHNGRFAKAQAEAATARELDPAIKFTSAAEFAKFEQLLQREQGGTRANPPASPARMPAPESSVVSPPAVTTAPARTAQEAPVRSGLPSWIWIVGLAAAAWFLWRGFNRSRAAAAPTGYGPGQTMAGGVPMPSGGPGGAMPYGMPQQQAPGGGMLGTGLAVAGGVAGGMMLERLLHPGQSGSANAGNFGNFGNTGGGGDTPLDRLVPGAPGLDAAGRELETRSVDFGNGNDWDSGGSSDAGGSDGGGSDGGGGWD